MEVILLERIAKLGQMGDVVRVKDGFARNFLLPNGKALRATKENRSRFEGMKVELVAEKGFAVSRAQIALNTPIKAIGLHKVPISLHPEVEVTINVAVARNADEAERVARGEDVTAIRDEAEQTAEEVHAAAETFFEPEGMEARRSREAAEAEPPAAETEAGKKA
jgi:large subunit ribosomal protein L9